ncbi:hypothetical protein ACFWWC_26055 [Streptomyces sp. NPDC058642]|uniref:hypothetical protein n=1 Tax=Streptomyces sp. NPDC058642 TaxID=3346572 RepID=UPI00366842E9
MRTTAIRAARTVAAAAGAVLVTGCGGDGAPSTVTAATSPASFGQEGVRGDLEAAVAAAGLPEGKTEAGYSRSGRTAGPATTAQERKLAALITRLSPCVVSWSTEDTGFSTPAADSADPRRQLDVVLAGLEKRDWKQSAPSTEAPLTENGTYFMAGYEKQGWTLHARHSSLPPWRQSTVMVTEDDCFSRVTEEEQALLDAT